MLIKYLAKPTNIVLTSALLSFLWGSICTIPGWAMEEEQEKNHVRTPCKSPVSSLEESSFKDSPTEIVQLILSFLPLDSFVPVNQVCKAFQALASDEHGPFKEFIVFKKTYENQKTQLLKLDCADIMSLGQTLSNLRKSLNILTTTRSQEELTWLATQLFEELKTQDEKSNHFTERTSHLGKMWPPLALLRACDAFWAPAMEEWLKTTARNKASFPGYYRLRLVDKLHSNLDTYDAFILLGESAPLRSAFTALTHKESDEENAYLLALELCERDQQSVNFVADVAQKYFHFAQQQFIPLQYPDLIIKYFQLAIKYCTIVLEKQPLPGLYYTVSEAYSALCANNLALQYALLALEKCPDPSPNFYSRVASCYEELSNWALAADYYDLALKMRSPHFREENYLKAGYASAKAKRPDDATVYFEKFINLIEEERPYVDTKLLYDYGYRLPPDVLDLMEEVLSINNSNVPFREWINGARRRRLERESLSAPQEPSKTSTTNTLSTG